MKNKLFLLLFFTVVIAYVVFMHDIGNKPISNRSHFNGMLSAYGLFRGEIASLEPAAGVEILDLGSTLFTDYAEKQRLIRLPKGKRMRATGNSLPEFPEGTIIAKTFYYSYAKEKRRRLIETRLLILQNGLWNAATYQWDTAQKDAILLEKGAIVPVSYQGKDGIFRQINYQIPSQKDCGSCHRSDNQLIPIGPTIRNLNIEVIRNGKSQSQLVYLHEKGLLDYKDKGRFGTIPNFHDVSLPTEPRARAYMAMNCAHCHRPTGMAGRKSLNLDFATSYKNTGIPFNKQNIIERTAAMGAYHMPKMGTTVIDTAGVALIRRYILSLK
ncbi:putative repeat protein (TIGR03806 family) [Pedobacter sp. W3I1]|uniref:c-type cytochrome n=1 Tax=Pedobacter sp. W3I1 TaxID=3042291 RepID=UPI002780DD92|nr:c-type cytochrome [Pedobacter sp. W3I1]MDQ0640005.1 putative repeat protein (TIGR03806 family) [Pedobacter sp. W3I1]